MEQVEEKMMSLEEIILQTENSLKGEDPRVEITRLKALFYKTKEALMGESKKQWLEAGNDEDSWSFECPEEERFKEGLEEYKRVRAEQIKEAELESEKAYERKMWINYSLKCVNSNKHGRKQVRCHKINTTTW